MDRREELFINWCQNKVNTQEKLVRFVNLSQWEENNRACRLIHQEHDYEFLSPDQIIHRVRRII